MRRMQTPARAVGGPSTLCPRAACWRGPTLAVLMVAAACGCAQPDAAQPPADPAPPADAPELPAGHPPVATSPPPMTLPPLPAGAGRGASGLVWTAPEAWVAETPSSSMRRAQYRIPGPGGDAECVVYYFGPGQGGDAEANALRWADQFTQPDGRPSRELLATSRIEVAGMTVTLAAVTGIYSGGMIMGGGPSQALADYMLLGAIVEGPDANWFFKMTGPQATVEAERERFEAMIRSARGGAAL